MAAESTLDAHLGGGRLDLDDLSIETDDDVLQIDDDHLGGDQLDAEKTAELVLLGRSLHLLEFLCLDGVLVAGDAHLAALDLEDDLGILSDDLEDLKSSGKFLFESEPHLAASAGLLYQDSVAGLLRAVLGDDREALGEGSAENISFVVPPRCLPVDDVVKAADLGLGDLAFSRRGDDVLDGGLGDLGELDHGDERDADGHPEVSLDQTDLGSVDGDVGATAGHGLDDHLDVDVVLLSLMSGDLAVPESIAADEVEDVVEEQLGLLGEGVLGGDVHLVKDAGLHEKLQMGSLEPLSVTHLVLLNSAHLLPVGTNPIGEFGVLLQNSLGKDLVFVGGSPFGQGDDMGSTLLVLEGVEALDRAGKDD